MLASQARWKILCSESSIFASRHQKAAEDVQSVGLVLDLGFDGCHMNCAESELGVRDSACCAIARVVLASIVLVIATTLPCEARQSGCESNQSRGARWSWTRDATIAVIVDPEFVGSPGGRIAVVEALRRWELAGSGNGSRVTFELRDKEDALTGGPTLRFRRGTLKSGRQAHTVLISAGDSLSRAICVIDRRVTDPLALLQVAVHEIGHTFGLAECDDCPPGSSVMTRSSGVDYNDTTSGAGWPSECDNAAVRENGGY